jgi:hypothetical protein
MNPLFSYLDLNSEDFNSDNMLSKARGIINDYKNNPAYIEFWPLVECLETAMIRYSEKNSKDLLSDINDVLFEIHLVELFQAADKKYNQLKDAVQKAIDSGGPDVGMLQKHFNKFVRIEKEYIM